MERLDRFDRAVKHRFGWFFYMVHGNLIEAPVATIVADAIRNGQIHLTLRDEAVLMAWADEPYRF